MTAADRFRIGATAALNHGGGLTGQLEDRQRCVLAIRAASTAEEREIAIRLCLNGRAVHRAWITVGQRDWQAKVSRRPARGRHHDSWAIREKYVRCHSSEVDR